MIRHVAQGQTGAKVPAVRRRAWQPVELRTAAASAVRIKVRREVW
jgi:hypothetical protein